MGVTRINVVPVAELSREHLIAEYRELPRVFALIRAAQQRGESPLDIRNPLRYTLGEGHVRFFYNKLEWLSNRFYELTAEMRARGYRVGYPDPPTHDLNWSEPWCRPFLIDERALRINRARIFERSQKNA